MKNPSLAGALGPAIAIAVFVGVVLVTAATRDGEPDAVLDGYRRGLARLDSDLVALDSGLMNAGERGQVAFRNARASYKRVEMFIEYYGRSSAIELNNPPLPRAEDEDPEQPLPPTGFQVIEAELFPIGDLRTARRQIQIMRTSVRQLAAAGFDSMPGEAFIFDAARHELNRVATLGIAGFDATVSGDAIIESAYAIEGVADALAPFRKRLRSKAASTADSLDVQFARAILALRAAPDFDRFDRLGFIAKEIRPLAASVADAQRLLDIGPASRPRAWSTRSASLFDHDAFDPMFFAATDAPVQSIALIALGRDLFFEPALSGTGGRSCASCHLPERAFTEDRPRTALLSGHDSRKARNTPTLINSGLQPRLFWDQRVRTLEDQATDVIGSAAEMGSSLSGAADRLAAHPRYADRIRTVVPSRNSTAVVRLAIAAYVRSLTALNSRFDQALRGNVAHVTAQERDGFNLFMGKAACGTCHFAPLFTGALPPQFLEDEPETIGTPVTAAHRSIVDPDSGRTLIRRIDRHAFAFRTPTVRNVELTGPYMHNGVFRTLEEVVDFYDGGGGAGRGIRITHQTLPTDSLHLTAAEKKALVAFLRALTDTTGTQPP
jgi:cytochrome c peroxidase